LATIKGFKGIRYNPEKINNYESIVAPPYDVINHEEQNKLYEKAPNNVIRLILPKGEGEERYKNASKTFIDWLESSVLINESEPAIYPYYQEFDSEGNSYTRKGFIATVKVEDFTKNVVLPHEQTFRKHREDRLKLTTACNANLSQVFSVYSDDGGAVEKLIDDNISEPIIEVTTEDGVKNTFWKITDPGVIGRISDGLSSNNLLIADGHHRYETAINYRNQQREKFGENSGSKPYDFVMMYLSRGGGDGLIINPTHRAVKNMGIDADSLLSKLGELFDIEETTSLHVNDLEFNEMVFISADSDKKYKLSLKGKPEKNYENLAVMILHNIIFKNYINEENAGILYTKFHSELSTLVNSGDYEGGFLLPKLNVDDIFEVVLDNVKMPHKTTYFYPKILSGLVFNPLW